MPEQQRDAYGAASGRGVGREAELALLHEFLAPDGFPGALLLTGEPGIGKTTLWEAGIVAARDRGLRVLAARSSGAEAQLAFASLIDLLDEVDTEALAALPAPQRYALEVALLRSESTGVAPEPRAIAVGLLNALRMLAGRHQVLLAIDDVAWLDSPSSDALTFAARRLQGDAVGFLLARRPGDPSVLEQALGRRGLKRLELGPLSLGATRLILSERLGLSLPRSVLRRIYESTRGNPLFALELGRTLADRETAEPGEELPVPDLVEDLLGTRVERLLPPVRRLLLAVALSADLRASQLGAIAHEGAIEDAVDAGVLLVEGDRVRPSHPLLAAAAASRARPRERRELHLELAHAVTDATLRARHLALATERPDPALAAAVAAAATGASARGAAEEAVELAEQALRLTPRGSVERHERLLALAELLLVAGEEQRVTDLLAPAVDELPPGAARGRAHLLLADGAAITHLNDVREHLERARAECGGDPALHATVVAKSSEYDALGWVERLDVVEASAQEALSAARGAGPQVERLVLYALGWARILRGRPVDDLAERFRAASDVAFHIADSLERVAAVRLIWRGEVNEARATITLLLALADERGEAWSYVALRLHLCELELRAGDWEAAARLLDEWEQSSDTAVVVAPTYERCRALLAAGRGLAEEAEGWVTETIAGVESTGVRWDLLEALRARGIAALAASEPARAVESLRAVWEHAEREGVGDPGAFPVAPELVEALVELGELEEAQAVTDRLRELAEEQHHPWGRATAKRCAAVARLASQTYDDQAAVALMESAAAYDVLGLRFDRARSLLVLGRAQRRRRKWAAARRSLEQAVAAFEEMGSTGWAEEAHSELARVGARRPSPAGELTPAERRVVQLAAEGLSNKEIACILFVTAHTVEVHLSHAYAKLGVHSRAQLAGHLAGEA